MNESMILVTGGTGCLGSHLLFELLTRGQGIRAIKRSTSDTDRIRKIFSYYTDDSDGLFSKIQWFDTDLTDQYDVDSAIRGVEYVYHLAAQVSLNPTDKYSVLRTNIVGTSNIVNACLEQNVKKLCFVSSISALGNTIPGERINEEAFWAIPDSRSHYAVSKYRSELAVWRGMNEGLNAIIVIPSFIIGPGSWHRSTGNLFRQVWNGLKYYTDGATGFVDVRDVVKSMVCLMDGRFSGERYLISSENLSYREILEKVARALGKPLPSKVPGPLMMDILCGLDWLKNIFTGKDRLITRELISASKKKNYYSNEKIIHATGMEFIPVHDSINDTARLFLRDMNM